MSVFSLLNNKEYESLIKDYNPEAPTPYYQNLVKTYVTPSSSYIKVSARGKGANDVQPEVLQYIISECHQCSFEEKYRAILIVLHMLHTQRKSEKNILDIISKAKEELTPYVLTATKKKSVDLSFIDNIIKPFTDNFLYVCKIIIGANTIYKYGISQTNPRKRMSQIKSDIVKLYGKQSVTIEVELLIHCKNVNVIEDEIKSILSENNIFSTGYNFKGSSETFPSKDKEEVLKIITTLEDKYNYDLLYNTSPKSKPSYDAQHVFD